jgi:hypothetical protein
MSIFDLTAVDLFDGQGLPYYTKGMDFFYLQLVELNVNIFILGHVLSFPFDLFVRPDRSLFFKMVIRNFFDASLLIVTRVAADQGDGVFTLQRFKNRVRELIRMEYQPELDNRLREARFDSKTQALLKKARDLRTERVAHSMEDIVLEKSAMSTVVFSDIKTLAGDLESVLNAISFNVEHLMLPLQYHPKVQHPQGVDSRPDIEILLDSVAERSSLLRMPEQDPIGWKYERERITREHLQMVNKYRGKFGLSNAT